MSDLASLRRLRDIETKLESVERRLATSRGDSLANDIDELRADIAKVHQQLIDWKAERKLWEEEVVKNVAANRRAIQALSKNIPRRGDE